MAKKSESTVETQEVVEESVKAEEKKTNTKKSTAKKSSKKADSAENAKSDDARKAAFQKKLAELLELAKDRKNVLEYQEISDYFKELQLSAEQFEAILDFDAWNFKVTLFAYGNLNFFCGRDFFAFFYTLLDDITLFCIIRRFVNDFIRNASFL